MLEDRRANAYASQVASALIAAGAPPSMINRDVQLMLRSLGKIEPITLSYFHEIQTLGPEGRVETKGDGSPVTEADTKAERAVRDMIDKHRPMDGFLGEEFGEKPAAPALHSRRWVLDPVDGTMAFAHAIPTWASMIALQSTQWDPQLGRVTQTEMSAVAMPENKLLWLAVKGHGAWRVEWSRTGQISARRIHVNNNMDLGQGAVCLSSLSSLSREGRAGTIFNIRDRAQQIRLLGNCWSHLLVAEGAATVAVGSDLAPTYDVIPLMHIVEEAGGKSSPVAGMETGPVGADGSRPRVTLLSANPTLFKVLEAEIIAGEAARLRGLAPSAKVME